MLIGFEDAFTSVQAEYISLCLELAQNNVDIVYAYIYQDSDMEMFNAFFRKDGKLHTADDFGSDEMVDRFLDIGVDDITKLVEVCDRYEHKCPNQIKMTYDVKTKHFDAQYVYADSEDDVDPNEVFFAWLEDEKNRPAGTK